MPSQTDFPLPSNLPRPIDDGAARHLVGMTLPKIGLRSTAGRVVQVSELAAPRTVIYAYPMTGVPGKPLPENWDSIPGARGCTPQACNFRDHHQELLQLGVEVFGLSTQRTEYQREMAERLHLPFEVLSDDHFHLCDSLHLPTFEVEGHAASEAPDVDHSRRPHRARTLPGVSIRWKRRRGPLMA